MLYRYSHWDGSQEFESLEADELMDSISDELLSEGDLRSILKRITRWGMDRPIGERFSGLQDLLKRLQKQRQEQLERYKLDSVLDDIKKRLESIVQKERDGIEKRLNENRESLAEKGDDTQGLHQLMENIANKKKASLDALPPDPAGAIKALSDYDFMDSEARQEFQDLLKMLQQRMMENYFQGMQQSLQNMTPEDLQGIRDMVKDLNQMLQEKARGGEPDFQSFMQKHGRYFPPGINSLDELMDHLQRSMAQMQSLMQSMTPEMRQSLQGMMDSLLRDDRLKWELAQMAGLLQQLRPMEAGSYPFQGDEPLTLSEAMRLMGQLQDMDQLEQQLAQAQRSSNLDGVDQEKMAEIMGDDARRQLEELKNLEKLLEDAGYVQRRGNALELTPKGARKIGQKALREIFQQLKRDRVGKHESPVRGVGGERSEETKRYEFGDPFLVDLERTLMNALTREGAGSPLAVRAEDFEVYRTELQTQCSTALLVDMSRSMLMRGLVLATKKVAIALNSLIRSQFPKDNLYIIGFTGFARVLKPESLPELVWDDYVYGTNMQHALMLSRQLLARHKGGNRQVIMVTDGEPTAHLERGQVFFSYPPTYKTIEETLKEVLRCTKENILINIFMLERSPYLTSFVNQMTKINKGRAFFASPEKLGEYILVDYMANKSKKVV
ncbi:MAG: VWA domain-containing protein [Dehalococcoidia bacterium]|nr:VWA domain-containing protein [Dehalococcoidia bacterium]